MFQWIKNNSSTVWLILVLMSCLIVMDVVIYSYQKRNIEKTLREHIHDELRVFGPLIQKQLEVDHTELLIDVVRDWSQYGRGIARVMIYSQGVLAIDFQAGTVWQDGVPLHADLSDGKRDDTFIEVFINDHVISEQLGVEISRLLVVTLFLIVTLGYFFWRWNIFKEYRQNQSRLSAIIDNIPFAIHLKDRNGCYLLANQQLAQNLGVVATDIIGKSDYDLYSQQKADLNRQREEAILKTSEIVSVENNDIRNGQSMTVMSRYFPVSNQDGRVQAVGGIEIDVSAYARAREELVRATRALKVISEVDVAMVRANNEREWLNSACQSLVETGGYRFAWIGFSQTEHDKAILPVADAGHEEGYLSKVNLTWNDLPSANGPEGRAVRDNKACVIKDIHMAEEVELWHEDALKRGYRSVCAIPVPIKDASHGVLALYSSLPDVFDNEEMQLLSELAVEIGFGVYSLRVAEERLRAEEALVAEKHKFEGIVENIKAGVALLDPGLRIIWANSTFVEWFGAFEEIQGNSCCDYFDHAEGHAFCSEHLSHVGSQSNSLFFEQTIAGEEKWFEVVADSLCDERGERIQYVIMVLDITDKKRMEQKQKDIEMQLNEAQRIAQVGSWSLNFESGELIWSDEVYRIFEIDKQDFDPSYEGFLNVIHPDDRHRVEKTFDEAMEKGTTYETAHRILLPGGRIKYVHEKGDARMDDQGRMMQAVGTVQDVTDLVLVEKALLDSEEHFRSLVETTTAIPWEYSVEKERYSFVGPQAMKVLGYPVEDWYQDDFWRERIHPDDRATVEAVYKKAIALGEVQEFEYRMLAIDGRAVWLRNDVKVVMDDGKPERLQGFMFDITERKQADELLRRSQKMEAVGQLTGGIAHDFNNQLGIVLGYLDFLAEFTKNQQKPHQWVSAADKATKRCIDLSRKLLNFSRQNQIEEEQLNVNGLLERMEELIAKSVTPKIEVRYELAEELWPIEVNTGELEDTILNLAINARDAMPSGGTLKFTTQNHTLDDGHIQYFSDFRPGDYVHITVQDTGCGISKEMRERVFEPFFTTKQEGKGTGLGLAMVYGFVQRCGGMLTLFSEPDEGTTFHIYLPRYIPEEEGRDIADVPVSMVSDMLGRGEVILVVDDEPELRGLAMTLLGIMGFKTIEAANGTEALSVLQTGTAVDLLFSDIIMPGGMNGYELAEKALVLRPEIKVLLTSGFTGDAAQVQEYAGMLLHKPYSKTELAQSVKEVLGIVSDGWVSVDGASRINESYIVDWSDDLLIGHDVIDDDHKYLMSKLDEYSIAIQTNQEKEKAGTIFEDLIEYTGQHFAREEAMMLACKYPQYSNHRQVHEMLLKMVKDLLKVFRQATENFDHQSTINFLRHWLLGHISSMDMSYASYLKGHEAEIEQALALLTEHKAIAAETGSRPRLVVIDDEASMGELVADVADASGFDATQYVHATEFVSQHDDTAEIIVLDLLMPDFDGIEMIRLLAGMECKSALVLISGVDQSVLHSAHELAIEHGLNIVGTLQKPFHPAELKKMLDEVSSHLREESQAYLPVTEGSSIQLNEIAEAIKNNEFIGYYQPQVSMTDNHVVGFEVLMRWQHPERGLVPPYQFISLAESSGLINEMTWNLLDSVAEDWKRHNLSQQVSINMTADMFKSLDLPERLSEIAQRHDLREHSLFVLEVTESALMEELTKSLDSLTRLRMKGFQLSIDDFGTGYSSMVQLYRAPFSELKVDQSFVMRMEQDAEARAIVESTIDLAHNLNMKVVAEGVESESILHKLSLLGCDIAQGYHIARPMPIDEAIEWMAQWQNKHGV